MSRRKRNILISCGVVAVLAAVLVILLLTQPIGETESSLTPLLDISRDNISTIAVGNAKGEYTLKKADTTWKISPYEQVPADQTNVWDFATKLQNVTPTRVVDENPSNIEQYGLSSPALKLTVTLLDGTTKTFLVGNKAGDEYSYYSMVDGDKAVYLINVVTFDPAMQDAYYFMSTAITESVDKTQDNPITRVEFKGPETGLKPIVIERLPEGFKDGAFNSINYRMTYPKESYFMYSDEAKYIEPLLGLTAETVAVVGLTDDILEKAELTEGEAYTATYTIGGVQHTIAVGKQEGDHCIVRFDKNDFLYLVKTSSLPWKSADYFTLVSKYPYAPLLSETDSVTITAGEDSHTIKVTGDNEDEYALNIDGNAVEYKNFKNFYRVLNHYYGSESAEGASKGALLMNVTWNLRNGTKRIVNFYESGTRRMMIEVDGQIEFLAKDTYIDRVLSDILIVRENKSTSSAM